MVHRVKQGETMYHLSRMYNVSIDELISANPGVNVYNMQNGDEVCIPVSNMRPEYVNDEDAAREFGRSITGSNMVSENTPQQTTTKEDFYEMVKRFDK